MYCIQNHPLSLVEFIGGINRQVFWLQCHHFSSLPGFPVAFLKKLLYYSGGTAWDSNPLPF
jgi:hypothetical protein